MSAQLSNVLFIVAMVAIFYLLVIRPQQKRAAQQRELIARLQPGARIVTIGGIHGTITEVGDVVRVRTVDGSQFELSKQAVAQVLPAQEEDVSAVEADDVSEGSENDGVVVDENGPITDE